MTSRASVILRYAREFWEHYLWLHALVSDHFPPWGRWKPRSTIISERLNGIVLMHAHQEIVPDTEKVIDLFAVTNGRLNFIWILLVFNQYVVFTWRIIFANITCIYFSDISGLIYIIIIPVLMEHAQIFKLSVKTNTLTYFCIIVDCGY